MEYFKYGRKIKEISTFKLVSKFDNLFPRSLLRPSGGVEQPVECRRGYTSSAVNVLLTADSGDKEGAAL